ncbi:Zinc finger protein 93 [Folsomia candida]|uniref:Zinc finger protein 93 n=1 Tax=Folsomia candida TaxID=158441 RepID=A0A226D7E8_FOLCA|nr:Zinc finger protein 93 [Folsomia candida]
MLENAGLINMSKAYCILCLDLTPPTSSKFETTTEVEISTLSHLLVPSLDIKHLNETCLLCEKCSIHFHQTVEIRQEISKLEDQIAKKVDVMRTTILNSEQKKQICWNNEDKEFGSILRMRQYFFPFTTDENDDELEIKTEPENCPDFQDTEAVRNWHVIDGITTTATNNSDLKFDPPSSDEEDASSSFSGLPDPLLVPSTRKRTIPSSTVQKSAKSSRMPNTFSHQNDDDSSSEHEQSENNDCTDRDEDWTEELEEGNEPASHQCTKCGKIVSKKGYLTTHSRRPHPHIRLHKGEKPFKCDHCEEAFIDTAAKQSHTVRVHLVHHRQKCDLCEKTFISHWALLSHVNNVHKRIRKTKCVTCGDTFIDAAALQSHRIQEHGDDPLTCEECGAKYISIGGLKRHKLKHSGVKSETCHLCDARFLTKQELQKHEFSHSDVRNFVCNHCGRAFKQSGQFRRHLNRVHKEKLPSSSKPRGKLRFNMSKKYCILCLDLTPPTSSKFKTTTKVEISTLSRLLVPCPEIKHENETCTLCDECALNYHQIVDIRQEISKLEDQIAQNVDVMRTALVNSEPKKEICGNNEDEEFGNVLKMREQFFPFATDGNDNELEIKTEQDENCADFQDTEAEATQNWQVIDGITTTTNDDSNFDPPSSDDGDESSSSFCILPDPLLLRSTRKRKIPPQTVQKPVKRGRRPTTRSRPKDDDDSSSEEEEESENDYDNDDKDEDWTEELEEGNEPVSNQCTKCGTELCDARFWTKEDLQQHKLSHSDVRNFVCNHCGRGFKVRSNFARHLDTVHKEKLPARGRPKAKFKSTA